MLCQVTKAIVDEGEAKAKIAVFGPFEEFVVGGILSGSIPVPGCTPVVNLDRIEIVQTLPVSIWTRDHAPIGVIHGKGQKARVAYVDTPYYLTRPHDDVGPMWLGLEDGQPPLEQITKVKFEGGNLLTDGQGRAWTTDIILSDTARYLGVDPDDEKALRKVERKIRKELKKKLGIEELMILPSGWTGNNSRGVGDDALGLTYHVDMGLKIASADRVIVGQYVDGSESSQRANEVLDNWAQHFADHDYEVFRLVNPPNGIELFDFASANANGLAKIYTYTNSLILNDIVIMPSYAEAGYAAYDDAAEAVYNAALPNHTVVRVDASILVPLSGSIHCITREIPAGQKLQGTLPSYEPRASRFVVVGEATAEGQGLHMVASTGLQSPNPQPKRAYSAVIAEQMGMDVSFGDDDTETNDFVLKDRSGQNWYFPGIYNVLAYDHETYLSDFGVGSAFYPPDDDTLRNRYLFPGDPPRNRLEQALELQPETLIIDIGEEEPTLFFAGDPGALPPEGVAYFYNQVFLALASAPKAPARVAVFTMSNDIGWIARSLDRLGAVAPTSSVLFTAPVQPFLQAQYDLHNDALRAAVSAHGGAVVELDALMQSLFSNTGITIGGKFFDLDTALEELVEVTISYDLLVGGVLTPVGTGVGFTPLMHKVIAYRAIETINGHYGTEIPLPCLGGDACDE